MKEIKNIIFDLGGVLLNLDYFRTIREFQKLGIENFEKLYSQKNQSSVFDNFETGKINPQDFISNIDTFSKKKTDEKDIIVAWNAMLLDLPPERLNFIKSLKSKYRIFLLSNTNEIHIDSFEKRLQSNNLLQQYYNCFEGLYYSCRIGLRKPDLNCFNFVLKTKKLLPRETLFIDDSIQHIKGARGAGMQAVLLEKNASIIQIVPDIIQSIHR